MAAGSPRFRRCRAFSSMARAKPRRAPGPSRSLCALSLTGSSMTSRCLPRRAIFSLPREQLAGDAGKPCPARALPHRLDRQATNGFASHAGPSRMAGLRVCFSRWRRNRTAHASADREANGAEPRRSVRSAIAGAALLVAALLTAAPAAHAAALDRNLVGAWVLPVNARRWLWQINQDG